MTCSGMEGDTNPQSKTVSYLLKTYKGGEGKEESEVILHLSWFDLFVFGLTSKFEAWSNCSSGVFFDGSLVVLKYWCICLKRQKTALALLHVLHKGQRSVTYCDNLPLTYRSVENVLKNLVNGDFIPYISGSGFLLNLQPKSPLRELYPHYHAVRAGAQKTEKIIT